MESDTVGTMKLYKKTIILWGKTAKDVQGASEFAVRAARCSEFDVVAFGDGIDPVKADPEKDPDGDASVMEYFNEG
jgi:hypothetical protein